MTVVLDTNVLLQIFGRRSPWKEIKNAWFNGSLSIAISTPILLEYEEVVRRYADEERWLDIARAFELTNSLFNNVRQVSPTFQFRLITADPDDNAFVDCAIAAEADYIHH